MATTPSDPRDRFYGRITGAFHMACPGCGTLLHGGNKRRQSWNAKLSELECYACGATWVIGLAAWRKVRGTRLRGRPMDQVPDANALRQLRAEAQARASTGAARAGTVAVVGQRAWQTNLQPECTCAHAEAPMWHVRTWTDPHCPRHGMDPVD